MRIGFYHCTRTPLLPVAAQLAQKAHESGERLLIAGAEILLGELDELLWSFGELSFLPHAMAGVLDDAEQPVLLATAGDGPAANGARILMRLAGALPPDLAGFERILNIFEDKTPAHAQARADWRRFAAAESGASCEYWQQGDSGWQRRQL